MRAIAMVCSAAFAQAAAADEAQDNWPSPVEMLASDNPDVRLFGEVSACTAATFEPALSAEISEKDGWADESDNPAYFQFSVGTDRMSFNKDGTTCLPETTHVSTKEVANIVGAPTGTNAAGCDLYDIGKGIVLTVTASGPDPLCQPQTGAALRFDKT